jgi:hypothetical protein
VNPVKKMIIQTECQVHIHINGHALTILKNDGYQDAFDFYLDYIDEINRGAVWADQDFKSSNHFYHPYKKKEDYTDAATHLLSLSNITRSLFAASADQTLKNPCFILAPHSI